MIRAFWEKARRLLGERRHAYRMMFQGPLAEVVLRDLARFCRAHGGAFHPDARKHAMLEGRREVWNRIQHHTRLTPDQLWDLYDGRYPTEETE